MYGGQSGVWKYASLARRSAIEAKFSHLVERLEQLTKQAWTLQNSSKPVGIQQDMRWSSTCFAAYMTAYGKQVFAEEQQSVGDLAKHLMSAIAW